MMTPGGTELPHGVSPSSIVCACYSFVKSGFFSEHPDALLGGASCQIADALLNDGWADSRLANVNSEGSASRAKGLTL